MKRFVSKSRLIVFYIIVLILLLSAYAAVAQDTVTEVPEPDTIIVVTSEPFEVTFGHGPFNLLSPVEGLSSLSSYRATLTVAFDGTNAGESAQWSRIYTLLVTQDPPTRELTIESSSADPVYRAEINGTSYERQNGGACIASPIEAHGTLAENWELAGFLDSVIGADEAGSEIVNNIAVKHYTFDERAQGASGIAKSTGELWVASDGGYLVRLTLTTKGGADYFGKGIEGTLSWDYQLADVNQPLAVELPADCPPGLLSLPVLPDAVDFVSLPGYTAYNTTSTLEDTLAFYREQVSALGGRAANPPLIMGNFALFGFTLNDRPILLTASSDLAGTIIELHQMGDLEQLAITAEVPNSASIQAAEATQNPTQKCATTEGTIPTLPDASSVVTMPGFTSYTTQTNVADVVKFYKEQFSALGAQIISEPSPSSMIAMLNITQAGQPISVTIASQGSSTSVSIMGAMPSAPVSDCNTSQSAVPQPTPVGTAPDNASTACSVSGAGNVNERTGPGANFARAGTLAGGKSVTVDGQAIGADGMVWWQLSENIWVRSDVVNKSGDCDHMPLIQP